MKEIISKEPNHKYSDLSGHQFLEKIDEALNYAGADESDIEKWCEEVVSDFNSTNTMGLPFQFLKTCNSDLVVNSRSLVNVLVDLS